MKRSKRQSKRSRTSKKRPLERWRWVVGYEGYYEVSNFGRVRSVNRKIKDGRFWKGRMKKIGVVNSHGSKRTQVMLHKDSYAKLWHVHSLVLRAFVGSRPEGMECRHLNGNALDNRLENLRWGTSSENKMDSRKHGALRGPARLDPKQVKAIRAIGKNWNKLRGPKRSVSCASVAKKFGVGPLAIWNIWTGKTYLWVK